MGKRALLYTRLYAAYPLGGGLFLSLFLAAVTRLVARTAAIGTVTGHPVRELLVCLAVALAALLLLLVTGLLFAREAASVQSVRRVLTVGCIEGAVSVFASSFLWYALLP